MRITPLDVRKQEFRRSVRGFDCDEVRAFLNTLADEYETVLVDNKQLRERLLGQEDKLGEYQGMERTLRDTLMTAERVMQDTREGATREGDLIIQESRLEAKRILEECRLRTEELRRELVGLRKEKETYLARFRTLAETQIQFVESHRSDFDDLDKRLVDMVDDVLEGIGDRVSAAPAAAVPDRARKTAARPDENVAPAAAPAPAPQEEIDRWRDYDPETVGRHGAAPSPRATIPPIVTVPTSPAERAGETAAPSPAPAPTAAPANTPSVPPATTPADGNPWQPAGWTPPAEADAAPASAPEEPGAQAARDAKLAALGIPVPSDRGPEEAEETVVALMEAARDRANGEPAAPIGL